MALFQVAAATAWVSAGAPEQPGALNVRCEDFTADRAQLLMGDNTMNASNSERAALRFLERNCCLCAKQLTYPQDWRRHMKKEHAAAWHEAETKISSKASSIQISRPCRFCRMNFTKTQQEPGQAKLRGDGCDTADARSGHQSGPAAEGTHGQGWLSLEGPQRNQIREALQQLSDSAALRLIGARLRPERSHRPLPKELQQMLQDEDL